MLSASAHKFNGPKGIGFLYSRNGLLQIFHHGGAQEFGMRAGTENVPAIVGMAVALKHNTMEMKHNTEHLHHLAEILLTALRNAKVDFILNGHPTERLPGNINISFKGKSGEGLMHMLDLKGICVSTGSACNSVNQQVSHVIKAIDLPADYCEGTIRVTFGKDNSKQDAADVANALIRIIGI
jgi:cysteine desulfurase